MEEQITNKVRRVYLDHAAATPIDEKVLLDMTKHAKETYGNPSSIHGEGLWAKKVLTDSRAHIAGVLGVHADEIIFTASATESCNLALVGTVRAWKDAHPDKIPHIIVSAIEHDAVLASVRLLEKEGVISTIVPVDAHGVVDVKAIESAITMDTVIMSIGYANNEIGTIQAIDDIARIIRKWKKEVRGVARDVSPTTEDLYPLFHTDACQATNYFPLNMQKLGVDMMTINSAKIYGPKGVALLAKKRLIPLVPILVGGGHEWGLRAGTENVPLIVTFARALEIVETMKAEEVARLTAIRDYARAELLTIEGLILNGVGEHNLPNIINFSITQKDRPFYAEKDGPLRSTDGAVSHEFLAIALDAKGFAVSTKSACNESDAEISHVLSALRHAGHVGVPSGIRLSLGRTTTKEDITKFVDALRDILTHMIVNVK